MLWVFYEDLLLDRERCIRSIAGEWATVILRVECMYEYMCIHVAFANIPLDQELLDIAMTHSSFEFMKASVFCG